QVSWVLDQDLLVLDVEGTVDRGGDRLQGCVGDGASDADTPHQASVDLGQDIGCCLGVIAGGAGVLAVLLDLHIDIEGFQGVGVRGQRTVTPAGDGLVLTVDHQLGGDGGVIVLGLGVLDAQGDLLNRGGTVQVLGGEDIPHLLGVDLTTLGVGDVLDHGGELHLHGPWHLQTVVGLHDVGDAALAGLGVHTDDSLVVAADILRVDGQVGNLPLGATQFLPRNLGGGGTRLDLGGQGIQALVDGILVGTGERGEHQVAAVRVALGYTQLVAVLDGATDVLDVGEVQLWVHTLGQHVQCQGDQADVAGALTIAEQAALDPISAGHVTQLRCCDTGAAVIVGMQGQDDGIATVEVAVHPLDGIRVDVRGDHLDGGRQVDDDRVLRGGVHDLHDGIHNILGVL